MNTRYESKKRNIAHNTAVAMILICLVFAAMLSYFRYDAKSKAYDELRAETAYIEKDLSLRISADRSNLINLANFAATLYEDGRSYDTMLESFEPIGLVSTIGILNPDNTFVTRLGSIDLSGKISFEAEAEKGVYLSGRMTDLTLGEKEIVRCAAPIISEGKTIGILYGGIPLDTISEKYEDYVNELNAQLFVYDKVSGKFIVDTLNEKPSELSMFIGKEYEDDHHYDDFMTKQSGFSSFKSSFRDENIYVFFSNLNDDWGIILGRYESDLFREMYIVIGVMLLSQTAMLLIIIWYFHTFIRREKYKSAVVHTASEIKKLLLEINQKPQNVTSSLQMIVEASASRSAMFMDEFGEIQDYIATDSDDIKLSQAYRKQFKAELFRYAGKLKDKGLASMCVIDISADRKLLSDDKRLYDFFVAHKIKEIIFSTITYNDDNGILGVVNPKNKYAAKQLIDEIDVCFSVAVRNRKHLTRTQIEATTDVLTGVSNRVAYEKALSELHGQKLENIACVFIDVNELHIRNNSLGYAAGDEMLIYIANSLERIFAGERIYRIGGDEFLVFERNIEKETVKENVEAFLAALDGTDYHVAIGFSYREQCSEIKEIVKEAESRMYDSKANYYQSKGQTSVYCDDDIGYIHGAFEPHEIEHILLEMKAHFGGILRISLENDTSHIILAKAYPGRFESDSNFSKRFANYVGEAVNPDYHRVLMSFANYDVLKKQLSDGSVSRTSYKKLNGETVTLSVYNLSKEGEAVNDTLWIFAKER